MSKQTNQTNQTNQIKRTMMNICIATLFLSTAFHVITNITAHQHEKILIRDVEILVFKANQMTTGRRTSPIKQMICKSGPCNAIKPENLSCKNVGWNGKDPVWDCSLETSKETKLRSISVECEGYDYPDDPYILKGSCAAIYNLGYKENMVVDDGKLEELPIRSFVGEIILISIFILSIKLCCCNGEYDDYHDDQSFGSGVVAGVIGASIFNSIMDDDDDSDSSWFSSSFADTSRR